MVAAEGRGATGIYWVEVGDAAQQPVTAGQRPHQFICLKQSRVLLLRNTRLERSWAVLDPSSVLLSVVL